jgi:iron complex outermembrane receptor protein
MRKLSKSTVIRADVVSETSSFKTSHKKRILASVSALSLALSFAQPGFAQTAQTAQGDLDEIVVTGTHIVRDGYEAPSPLTVVGMDQINTGAREDLANYINTLPAVVGAYSPQTQSNSTNNGQTGVSSVNLRGFGTVRTLVLLDGRRGVGTAADGTIDISEFPQELISRVDVVTGGASAAYGSDAIAGVVNFIIDKTFTGVKGSLEGGVTTYGDDRNWKVSLTAGTSFANDRGHFLISGSAASRDGLFSSQSRDWNKTGWHTYPNPAWNATTNPTVPQYLFLPQSGLHVGSEGGIITNTALKGTAFGPGGVPRQYNYGTLVSTQYSQGGDWQSSIPLRLASLDPQSKRQSLYTRAQYDITDNFQVFGEVSWANSASNNSNGPNFQLSSINVKADNAFIPESVRARMTTLGLTQFTLGRVQTDIRTSPDPTANTKDAYFVRRLNRYTIGFNGNFDAFESNWKWEAYGHTGATRTSETSYNSIITANFARAIDAVRSPTTGAIICRSTLTNPTNGCVPFNVMGEGVNGTAAQNYVAGTAHRNQKITQKNLAANINGEPFSTWAGPVSVAAGIEWRKVSISGSANALALAFALDSPNFQPTFGSESVTEGFLETVVPLAKDQAWAKSLDLNAAVRFTQYELSGFGTSYKVGATYQPIDDLRFRATRSHDFRAPNLGELFDRGSTSIGNIEDPFNNNAPIQSLQITKGNPNLEPEKANTTQFGVVFQPTFVPGLSTSVDYWNTKVTNVVGTASRSQILTNCLNGVQVYCTAITRTPGLLTVEIFPFNQASQHRNGVDFEAGYKFALGDVVDSWGGDVELRVLATRHIKAIIDPGVSPPVDYVGSLGYIIGTVNFGVPKWVYNTTISYSNDPITVTLTGRGFSSGKMDNTYTACTSGCPVSTANAPTINSNYMKGPFYVDAAIDYKVTENVNMFFSVQNLTNVDPSPYMSIQFSGISFDIPPVNLTLYDLVGRMFRAGVRFKF